MSINYSKSFQNDSVPHLEKQRWDRIVRRNKHPSHCTEHLILLFITALGFALRLPLLDRFPFREDEAIYAYWALHAWNEDPLFLAVWPDKPPLFIWLLAGTFQLFDTSALAARWLNILLSTLTIPVVAVCARKLSSLSRIAPLVAATTFALNPFAISFSATAFTDPMLVFCGMLAIYLALCGRSFWAGVWLATAIMTKQQGLFYLPLVVGILVGVGPLTWKKRLHFLFGILLIAAPILYWDSLRWATAPSPWDLSVRNYGALALLPPEQWTERANVWGDLLWYLTGSWLVWGVLAVAEVWCGWQRVYPLLHFSAVKLRMSTDNRSLFYKGHKQSYGHDISYPTLAIPTRSPSSHANLTGRARYIMPLRFARNPRPPKQIDRPVTVPSLSAAFQGRVRVGSNQCQPHHIATLLITLWTIAFITTHIITTIQPWDRYLLPLAPMLALLVGCTFARLVDVTSPARTKHGSERERSLGPCRGRVSPTILTLAWIALLLTPAAHASIGATPIGGDHGAYTGLDDAIAWIDSETNTATDERAILYHRVLGWHYRFYLYDQIRAGNIELRWFPHGVYLADNVAKVTHRRRFMIEPAWSPVRDLAQQARTRRLDVVQRAQFSDFIVFELSHEPQPFCDWCLCQPPDRPSWLHSINNNIDNN